MLKPVQLGRNSGLRVSELCLGTMNFGQPGRGHQGDWTLPIDDARPIFKAAIDNGLFYFDCADTYGQGACEEVVGELLRELLPRDEYVLATKIAMPMGRGANQSGLSRKHIMEGVDASLERLGLDYIDHLVIHRHPHGVPGQVEVPIEESLEALHDVVKAGKVLYLGGSSMFAWQFAELQLTAKYNGWTPFVSMQNHYNLLHREEEREMLPLCADEGVGVIPWSPLARGRLTRDWDDATARSDTDEFGKTLYLPEDQAIVERVAEIADQRGVPRAQVALAWVLSKSIVTAPIVGATKEHHIDDAVAALDLELTDDEVASLEDPYATRPPVGFA